MDARIVIKELGETMKYIKFVIDKMPDCSINQEEWVDEETFYEFYRWVVDFIKELHEKDARIVCVEICEEITEDTEPV